eukprot:2226702-Ditylum_brightwellii.AAC.1
MKDTSTVINKYKVRITCIVGENQDVKPRKKFTTLLSLIITCFPAITLEEWDSSKLERAQSITAGTELPHEHKHLEKYCPHDHHKSCLTTQWKVWSPTATFYKIKNNYSVITHIKSSRSI